MFTKSIRGRLVLWIGFLLLLILSGFGITAWQLHRINRMGQIDEELERRLAAVSAAVRTPPEIDWELGPQSRDGGFGPPPTGGDQSAFGPPPRSRLEHGLPPGIGAPPAGPRNIRIPEPTLRRFEDTGTNAFYFAIWSPSGTLLRCSTNAPAELTLPPRFTADTGSHTRMRGWHRELFHFTEIGDGILVGRGIRGDLEAMHRFAVWLVVVGGLVLALGLGGGWWLATRAIRPVQEISDAARRISEGTLSRRINLSDTDSELGQLGHVLNSTFARLEAAFEQQRQFTADAAHELRTPLAVMIAEAQTTLSRERNAAEYRETVRACLDSAQQMRRLTGALLELARLDAGQAQLNQRCFDLADAVCGCVESLRPLAAAQGIQFHTELQPVQVSANEDGMTLVITNLLTNAIHYNRPNGTIRIDTHPAKAQAVLVVSDTGIGIAAEDLSRVFERFYRSDKSRSRAEGHLGLGLAMTKATVEAAGGSIEVASEPGVGTTFTVRLPAHIAATS